MRPSRPLTATPRDTVYTERMVFQRLSQEHAPELSRHLRDPRVARWLWVRPQPPTDAELMDSLAQKIDHWRRYGFGLWLLRDRHTGEVVGRGGLQHTFVAGLQEVEVGWSIVPDRWGEGLATELALTSVEVAFDDLELPQIVAFTLPENRASRRVMEKAGFTYEREIEHVGLPHVLYRRRRAGAGAA